MPPKISIIIPVYNGEKYLERCLDSILAQTMDKYIVYAIDDGSGDNSLQILKSYESKNPGKIVALTQPNKGVAQTRNRGINLTETDYLMFIDQDDFIDKDYCETFYNAALEGDYDVVLGGFKRPGAGKKIVNKYVSLMDTPYAKYVSTGVFAKIHKTDFLKKHEIYVFDTDYGEDIGFILKEYAMAKRMRILEGYVGYNWFYNTESVSNTTQKNITNMLPLHLMLLEEIYKYDDKSPEFEYYVLQTVVFFLLWVGRSATKKQYTSAYHEIKHWLDLHYPRIFKNKYAILGPKGAPRLNRLSIGGLVIAERTKTMGLFASLYTNGKQ